MTTYHIKPKSTKNKAHWQTGFTHCLSHGVEYRYCISLIFNFAMENSCCKGGGGVIASKKMYIIYNYTFDLK